MNTISYITTLLGKYFVKVSMNYAEVLLAQLSLI